MISSANRRRYIVVGSGMLDIVFSISYEKNRTYLTSVSSRDDMLKKITTLIIASYATLYV